MEPDNTPEELPEEYQFKFGSTDDEVRDKTLGCIHSFRGVKYVSYNILNDLLTVRGKGIDQAKLQRKIDKLSKPRKGFFFLFRVRWLVATGDGMAMAHGARAVISNMEFVQFHPIAVADEGLPIKPQTARENAFLIAEGVRGDGAIYARKR